MRIDRRVLSALRTARSRALGAASAPGAPGAPGAFLAGLLLAIAPAPPATAETHTLRAGDTIAALGVTLKPGDQIVLEPGRHGPLDLVNLHGAPGMPIVVRGSNPSVPAAIQAGEFGIRIRGSSHLMVQDMIVIGGDQAAVIVEPAPAESDAAAPTPSAEITLRRVTIGRTPADGNGIVLRELRGGRLEQCRIERFGRIGVDIDACTDLLVIDPLLVGNAEPTSPAGIVIGSGSERVRLSGARVQGGIDVGVAIGVARDAIAPTATSSETPPSSTAPSSTGTSSTGTSSTGPSSSPAPAPASPATSSSATAPPSSTPAPSATSNAAAAPRPATSSIAIEQTVFRGCLAAVAIGSVDGLLIERSTFTVPRRFFFQFGPLPAGSTPPRDVMIRENLLVWVPNALRTLAEIRADVDISGVSLGRNLWWSEEFDLFREKLGPFPGRETAPQITTIDPRMGDFDLATNPDVAGFGAGN